MGSEVRRCEVGLRLLRQAAGGDALQAAATARRPRPRHRRRLSVWRRDFRHAPRHIYDRPQSGRSRNRPDRDQDLSKDRAPCSAAEKSTLARRGIPSRHDQPGCRVNRLLDDQRQDSVAIGATDEQSALAGGSTARGDRDDMRTPRSLIGCSRSCCSQPAAPLDDEPQQPFEMWGERVVDGRRGACVSSAGVVRRGPRRRLLSRETGRTG
jgi:hypothetical protein